MATLEDYKAALIKAHKSGDAQAAKMFAQRIQSLQDIPEPPPGVTIHTEGTAIETPEQERAFAVEQQAQKRANALEPVRGLAPALQGLGFEAGDEVVGAASGLISAATGGDFSDSYDIDRRAVEIANEREFAENPIRATGTQIAGAVGSGLAAPVVAPFRGGALATAGNATTTGASLGGVTGLAGAKPGERTEGAATGAAIGGVLGPLAQGAISGTQAFLRPITAQFTPKATSQAMLASILRRSGKSADEVAEEMRRAARDGQGGEFTLADAVGQPGQRALSTIARTPSDARAGVVEGLQQRQAGQSRRMASNLSDAFDAPDTAAARTQSLRDARSAEGRVNFNNASATSAPVDTASAIQKIDDLLIDLPKGKARRELETVRDSLFSESGARSADFQFVQNAKSQLGSRINDLKGVKGTDGGFERLQLGQVLKELDGALEAASPDYRKANDAYRAASNVIRSVDDGSQAAKRGRADDVIPDFQARTSDEQAAFRAGFADPLIAKAERQAFGNNAARPFTSPTSRGEFQAIAAPGKGDKLNRQIARENTMFETRNQAIGGSRTADNIADINDFTPGVLQNLARGRVLDASLAAGGQAIARAQGITSGVADELAGVLTLNSSDAVKTAIAQAIARQARRKKIDSAAIRALIAPTAAFSN